MRNRYILDRFLCRSPRVARRYIGVETNHKMRASEHEKQQRHAILARGVVQLHVILLLATTTGVRSRWDCHAALGCGKARAQRAQSGAVVGGSCSGNVIRGHEPPRSAESACLNAAREDAFGNLPHDCRVSGSMCTFEWTLWHPLPNLPLIRGLVSLSRRHPP